MEAFGKNVVFDVEQLLFERIQDGILKLGKQIVDEFTPLVEANLLFRGV